MVKSEKLIDRIRPTGAGHFSVEMQYRGRKITGITTNATAVDRFNSRELVPDRVSLHGYTFRECVLILRDEMIQQYTKKSGDKT